MSNQSLVQFRTTYMRVIAHSWLNDTFYCQLIRSNDAIPILKEFGYDWPYVRCGIQFIECDNCWVPDAGTWSGGSRTDKFILSLPLTPDNVQKDQRVQALADFYNIFPTLFGTKGTEERVQDFGGDNQIWGNWQSFLEFGGYIFRAIALAWNDKVFREALTCTLEEAMQTEYLGKSMVAMERYLEYRAPWNFGFAIINADRAVWTPPSDRFDSLGSWEIYPQNKLVLTIPNPPEDPELMPIALSLYNDTSAERYPFSCPC